MPLAERKTGGVSKSPGKDRFPILVYRSSVAWSAGTSMDLPRRFITALVIDGKIWVIGDYDTIAIYTPSTNAWSTRPYPFSFSCETYVATPNKKIYAIGGSANGVKGKAVEEFDPVTGTVKRVANLPMGAIISSAVATPNGKVYVIGGFNYPPTVTLNTVQEYNPATNTWTLKAPMPTARYHMPLVLTNSGLIYAIGGFVSLESSAQDLSVVEVYDPQNDQWTEAPSMPKDNRCHAAVWVRDRIFSLGGLRQCEGLNTVEEYIPAKKQWKTKTSLQTGRWGMAAAAIDKKIYVIGGLRRDHHEGDDNPDAEILNSLEIGTVTFKLF